MSATRWQILVLCMPFVFFVSVVRLHAQVLESDSLLRKQEDQQRARALTRDLLGSVLDVQLRQLDENGLSDQEIYRDIKLMRQNLNHLIETEMSKVVDLLSDAQKLPKEKRETAFVEARQQIRTIVRQLAIERQILLKRLKIAELTEQVRRLIRHQTAVQLVTKKLPAEPQTRQEAITLKAIEDQRDVKELFLQLVDTMVDLKSWSGTLAMAAADGLRILKAADVGKHLDEAGRTLQSVKYEASHDEQEFVLKGLRELLKVIERAQGALNSEKMASIDRLRMLTDRQKQLRDDVKKLSSDQQPSAEMVEKQSQLQKEISQLQELVRNNVKAETHIQMAETAALDAAANLLDNKQEVALADQGRVLGNLAALELALKEQAKEQSRDKSASELAQTVKALNETKASLMAAKQKQNDVEKKSRENAPTAVPDANAALEIVQKAKDQFELPATVETSLSDAADAMKQEAKQLESAKPEKATPVEELAVDVASKALDRALSNVESALVDIHRQESAVKIGELARAAEVLERTAAEERAVAKEATLIAQSENSQNADVAEIAKRLAERQNDVKAIAEKAAEATEQTAPEASKKALEGAKQANSSGMELTAVADRSSSQPATAAKNAAEAANTAAQKMADAAKDIRQEILNTSKDLAARTEAQAEKLAEARSVVENAVNHLPSNSKVAQLEAAQAKLSQAMQEQAKAQGKPDAAAAMELVDQISNALDAQEAAAVAAKAAERGVGSELKATTKQEEVAERSQAATESASKRPKAESAKQQGKPDQLAQALNDAQQAASLAAKQTLDGNLPAAANSRNAAKESLNTAMSLAQNEMSAALDAAPSERIEPVAQTKAAELAATSQELAAKASAEAGNEVAPAAAATAAAKQALATNPEIASIAQAKSFEKLQEAAKKLDAAIQKATSEQSKALAHQATETASLADRVANVDPAAAVAIDSAAKETRNGAEAADSPRQMTAAVNSAETALEHAAADLGAKEQEVRRDQAIAESVARLAQDQQMAAEVIALQSGELEKLGSTTNVEEVSTAAQQSAAQKLNDAQQQFADSQRATGQGAVELSGQTEVANPPLREALELASNLPSIDPRDSLLTQMMLPDGSVVPADGQPIETEQPVLSETQMHEERSAEPSQSQGDTHSETKGSQGVPGARKPTGLGTGFVPNSPQLTAEMMAGATAQQAARKALGQQLPTSEKTTKTKPSEAGKVSDTQEGQQLPSEHAESSKLTKKDGSATTNQKVNDGNIQKHPEGTDAAGKTASKSREKEDSIMARQLKEEAWFAKLPPELRKSIRAGVGQKPPRAYEERLKKYFESVD